MTTPYSDPSDGAEPRTAFQELADVERWAERKGSGAGAASFVSDRPLNGPLFGVSTATNNGMHHIVGISPRPTPGQEPAAEPPTAAERAVLRSVVRAALDLVGHESGDAWVEVVLTARGPRIATFRLGEATRNSPR
ncbi:hypothetical protein [Streptomyces sp. NPDC006333]|uniref:hypothetical protein n=1 Tax=Streptomyces sp. NPDC006333 TaxID=3156753 RepID=UPI0033B323F1